MISDNLKSKDKIKVKICDDFFNRWFECASRNENVTIDKAKEFYLCDVFVRLSERIAGKNVELFHCTYHEGCDDYFECVDDNFVIDRELFEIL